MSYFKVLFIQILWLDGCGNRCREVDVLLPIFSGIDAFRSILNKSLIQE